MQQDVAQNPLVHVADSEEIVIGFSRPDGRSHSTHVWVVRAGDDIYVRSMYGERGGWFRRLSANPDGYVRDGSHLHPVRAEPVTDPGMLDAVTRAYAEKYKDSRSVQSLLTDESRRATFRLVPREVAEDQ
jgi:hypothetical protein